MDPNNSGTTQLYHAPDGGEGDDAPDDKQLLERLAVAQRLLALRGYYVAAHAVRYDRPVRGGRLRCRTAHALVVTPEGGRAAAHRYLYDALRALPRAVEER